jgi:hypothetical protein
VVLAHQYLDQLPEDLRCALLGNGEHWRSFAWGDVMRRS